MSCILNGGGKHLIEIRLTQISKLFLIFLCAMYIYAHYMLYVRLLRSWYFCISVLLGSFILKSIGRMHFKQWKKYCQTLVFMEEMFISQQTLKSQKMKQKCPSRHLLVVWHLEACAQCNQRS